MEQPDNPQLIWIQWADAYGSGGAWENAADVRAEVLICETVGFLLDEDDKVVCVAQTIHEDGIYNSFCIPKGMIIDRRDIEDG